MTVLNPFAPPDVPDARLLVLVWNHHWFGDRYEEPLTVTTPHGARIQLDFTRDRRRQSQASAVWVHAPTMRDLPKKRRGQPWVLASMEADANYPYQTSPDARALFELRMTHHLDSDIPTPYANRHEYAGFRPAPRPPQQPAALVSFIASNPVAWRDAFVHDLMQHIPIDCFGACLNNRSIADVAPPGASRKDEALAVIASYPFYLAFENCREPDYVTEKLYRPLSVGTVPVYWGAPNVDVFIPSPGSVLAIDESTSPEALAARLTALIEDPRALARYRAWHDAPSPGFQRLLDLGDVDPRARMATKLAHGCGHDCVCGGRQAFQRE